MSSENERLRELDQLIRAAHAELGTLQFLLISAHERELNPAELGIHIANLGRQVSEWESERRHFYRRAHELAQQTVLTNHNELAQEVPREGNTARPRRAASLKKSNSLRPSPDQAVPLSLQCA